MKEYFKKETVKMSAKTKARSNATKAKRVGPSLHWILVPYQKCCIIEVIKNILPAHSFQSLQATATPPRCAYVCRRRNQRIVGVYFLKCSVTVGNMHK